MSKRRSRSRQLSFLFTDEALWEHLPEKNRLRSRTLLVQLLSEVVRSEETDEQWQEKESDDEREDPAGTP